MRRVWLNNGLCLYVATSHMGVEGKVIDGKTMAHTGTIQTYRTLIEYNID